MNSRQLATSFLNFLENPPAGVPPLPSVLRVGHQVFNVGFSGGASYWKQTGGNNGNYIRLNDVDLKIFTSNKDLNFSTIDYLGALYNFIDPYVTAFCMHRGLPMFTRGNGLAQGIVDEYIGLLIPPNGSVTYFINQTSMMDVAIGIKRNISQNDIVRIHNVPYTSPQYLAKEQSKFLIRSYFAPSNSMIRTRFPFEVRENRLLGRNSKKGKQDIVRLRKLLGIYFPNTQLKQVVNRMYNDVFVRRNLQSLVRTMYNIKTLVNSRRLFNVVNNAVPMNTSNRRNNAVPMNIN